MFHSIGWGEILVVLAVIVVIFGAAKLPQIAHSLGKSLTSFKKGLRETADDVKDAISKDEAESTVTAGGKDRPSSDSGEEPTDTKRSRSA